MIQLEAKDQSGLLVIPEAGRGNKGFYSESPKEHRAADTDFRALAYRTVRHKCVLF